MATYMIQSLLKMADDSMEHNPQEFHASQTQYEQLVRTYWCCFAQDCELSSGARQHFALSFSQISVPLPISDRDFTFNHTPASRLMPADMNKDCLLAKDLTIEHGLTIVTRGFDIFVRILRFANEHRRALASLSSNDSASPLLLTWQVLKEELDEWRSLQDVTVRFPATSVQSHVALGYGELFAYINLVHCMRYWFLFNAFQRTILTASPLASFSSIGTASYPTSNPIPTFSTTQMMTPKANPTQSNSYLKSPSRSGVSSMH